MPFWGLAVSLVYAMRRVDCRMRPAKGFQRMRSGLRARPALAFTLYTVHSNGHGRMVSWYSATEVFGLREGTTLAGLDGSQSALLRRVALWCGDYLTNPHPAVGRSGHVCPWVAPSLRASLFYFAVADHRDGDIESTVHTFLLFRDRFLAMEPLDARSAQLKTVVVVFSGVPPERAPEAVVCLHDRLKPHFVERGLMLGEFFPTCDKPGLHNADFRPLRSPEPLMVIRTMVPNDIAFLHDEKAFVRAYLRNLRFNGVDAISTFLEKERDRLPATRIAELREALVEFGIPADHPWREIDQTTGILTTKCLLRHVDARLTGDASEASSWSWIAFRGETEHPLGEGAAAYVLATISGIAQELVADPNQLGYGNGWFSIASWNDANPDPGLIERLRSAMEMHRFAYEGSAIAVTVVLGSATLGDMSGLARISAQAIDLLREAQRRAVRSERANHAGDERV